MRKLIRKKAISMKLREIILDFTSLLDVFMLILFFFILFSHFEVEEAQNSANQAQQAAEQAILDAEKSIESMQEQVDEELALLEEANHLKAVNVQALMQFSQGTVIQSKLSMDESGESWTLEFRRKEDKTNEELQIAALHDTEINSPEIIRILENQNFQPEDKIPLIFIYDGTEAGSETAFNLISTAFQEVKTTYTHFYCLEVDISDFEE